MQVRNFLDSDFDALLSRVKAYYLEDQKILFDAERLRATVSELATNPNRGKIELLEIDGDVVGYVILATLWSNEFGGTIIFLDEIFIDSAAREKGLGRAYIERLIASPPYAAVAIQLELTSTNGRARALYERIGFKEYPNAGLIFDLERVVPRPIRQKH